MNGNYGVIYFEVDGETVGLIGVALWADAAIEEDQVPSFRRRVSAYRPEVAVRALIHRIAGRLIDTASIRKREWELWCNIFCSGRGNRWTYSRHSLGRRRYRRSAGT